MVDGLDHYTCHERWVHNRNMIENPRAYAGPLHALTDSQIAAAKRYHRDLWDKVSREDARNGRFKPKLTILVDQED